MDIIFLRGLQIETIIGIYAWERETRQTVILDIEMGCDIRNAGKTDSIDHALDYKAVSKHLISFVAQSEFFLVEKLAEEIASTLLNNFKVPWLRLTLNKKGAIRGASDVGIIIERGEKP
ncbi:MAG: dihydroneopterin aldolase [Methylococcus sp.]|jgi:dihydroneopterin aldolase|nr:MAG: dihydroneopterin aldolase [Methylococcus sp.]